MKDHQTVISIFGSAGGVAKSILSILNHSASDTKDPKTEGLLLDRMREFQDE